MPLGVCAVLPVPGVTFILGNDLAEGNVRGKVRWWGSAYRSSCCSENGELIPCMCDNSSKGTFGDFRYQMKRKVLLVILLSLL